jgi:hypothetical protein
MKELTNKLTDMPTLKNKRKVKGESNQSKNERKRIKDISKIRRLLDDLNKEKWDALDKLFQIRKTL